MPSRYNRITMFLAASALLIGAASAALAGEYDGTWQLRDTSGTPFEAKLNKDGTAAGTHGDAMKHGTWEENEGAAVIHWDTGWTTRIGKQGDRYVKTAFKPGTSLSDKPTNSSEAMKKK